MRKLTDKIATLVLRFLPAVLLITIPLFFVPITPDFFGTNKQYLLFAIGSVALVLFCLRLVSRGTIQITLSPSLLPFVGFAFLYILSSTIKHPNPRLALTTSTAVIISLLIIFITTTSTQKTSEVVKSIIIASIASSTILAIFALLVNFGLIEKLAGPEWLKSKFLSPAGSPYDLLTFSLPILLASIGYGIVSKNWVIKPLVLAASIVITAGSIFSFNLLLPQDGKSGIITLPYSAGWSIAIDTLKTPRSALLGTGPDTFNFVFSRLKPSYLNQDNNLWSLRFNNSSSEFFSILTTTGIFSLVLFALIYFASIRSLLKEKFLSDPENTFLLIGLVSVFVLFVLFPGSLCAYVLGVCLLVGTAVKLKTTNHQSTKDVQLNLSAHQIASIYSDSPHKPHLPILPWILTTASVVLLGVFWNVAARIYLSHLALYQAAQTVKSNPIVSYNKQLEAIKYNPTDPYLKVNLSQTYAAIAKNLISKKDATKEEKTKALEFANQAINEAKAAANLSPQDVTVWENFASIARYLAENNVEGASDWTLATYTQAITLDPNNPSLRVQLGTFYYLLGDSNQAIKVLEQAIILKQNWSIPYYNIALIYKTNKEYPKALAYMKEGRKYALSNQDNSAVDKEIAELEKLVPTPTATPTPAK